MATLNVDLSDLDAIQSKLPQGKPIVMLNLLRFRADALYPDHGFEDLPKVSGREAGKNINQGMSTSPCKVTDPRKLELAELSGNGFTALQWAANRGDRTRTCDPWSPRLVLIPRLRAEFN
jgi:hypothetical protein